MLLATLHRVASTKRRWNASVDHRGLEALERSTLLNLSLLKFAKQLVLEALKVHALLLVFGDLFCKMIGVIIYICASEVPLFLDELILLCQTLRTLLTDLLLAELRLVVVVFAHTVQIVFHHFLLAAHLLNCSHLLVTEVSVAVSKFLLLFLASLPSLLSVLFFFLQTLLLLSTPLQHLVIILVLQILQLSRLLASLLNLFDGSDLLVLEHADAVSQLLNVSLQLQSDGASLVVSQVFALNVDDNVGANLTWGAVRSVAHHTAGVALCERVSITGACLAD